ncbi:MAG: SLC13 family permease [Bacteroidales bacterium]|nr:SLC13 family permease [Bacteroidales bacterium]MBN2697631.1 SLC13 family permease [Bacteroidales bacterium]
MTLSGYIAIFVILLMIAALIKEAMRPGLILFAALVIFIVADIITAEDALAGFSNKGMITIAILFLVSEGFKETGGLSKLGKMLLPRKRKPIPRLLMQILIPISAVSAFLNNTPVVIIFAPMLKKWADKFGLPAQKFLIPLSYATIFGGTCTLIGTSTNLVVHGMMLDRGMEGLSMFELAKVGLFISLFGFIYLNLFASRLLPGEKIPRHSFPMDTREYLFDVILPENSNLIGKEIEKRKLPGLDEFTVKTVLRDGKHIRLSNTPFVLEKDDQLVIAGVSENVGFLTRATNIRIKALEDTDPNFLNKNLKQVEVVIAPRFPGIQKTLSEFDFFGHYNAVVMAVHRNGERVSSDLENLELKAGDNLMLLTTDDFTKYWGESRVFYMSSEIGDMDSPKDRKRRWTAVGLTLLMVVGATAGKYIPTYGEVELDMFFFAAITVVLMAMMKIFSPKKYTKPINWDVLITIACAFGISRALQNSGAADVIAHTTINLSKSMGPVGVLAAIYLLTNIFTEIITNNAAAAISFPIAYAAAAQLGVDPKPFFIAICIAASASFSTPIGYQTNLIVQSIGNYKFSDYWKIGLPLNLIAFIISVMLIPVFWEF